jgi:hypothetical protein
MEKDLYFYWSGRQDSNLRPPGPKPGAMTGLRYAPNSLPGCKSKGSGSIKETEWEISEVNLFRKFSKET